MPITCFPDHPEPRKTATCALCKKKILLAGAAAGMQTGDGRIAFACNGHFWNISQLANGWADFTLREQYGPLYMVSEQGFVMGDGGNAWTLR